MTSSDVRVRVLITSACCPNPGSYFRRSWSVSRTMRVLDGIHGFYAARLRGDQQIEARLLNGGGARAFALAVQADTSASPPLSLAATQVMQAYP
jgi:hypothetical protein